MKAQKKKNMLTDPMLRRLHVAVSVFLWYLFIYFLDVNFMHIIFFCC